MLMIGLPFMLDTVYWVETSALDVDETVVVPTVCQSKLSSALALTIHVLR